MRFVKTDANVDTVFFAAATASVYGELVDVFIPIKARKNFGKIELRNPAYLIFICINGDGVISIVLDFFEPYSGIDLIGSSSISNFLQKLLTVDTVVIFERNSSNAAGFIFVLPIKNKSGIECANLFQKIGNSTLEIVLCWKVNRIKWSKANIWMIVITFYF